MSDTNQEVVRDYDGSVVTGDDSFMAIDYSYGDDVVFLCSNAGDASHITISSTEDTTKSTFLSSDGSPGAYDITDSISNDSDATKFSFSDVEGDTKWSDARARSGKRFEKGLGVNYFKSGRFDMKPVSLSVFLQI